MTPRRVALLASLTALALTGVACSPSSSQDAGSDTTATITVGAAASLTDVFEQIAADFTATSGIEVTYSFAASSALAEQIRGGAPLDAFASAGTSAMEPLASEQLVTGVTDFASNSLIIAVPGGNPGGVTGLADLACVSVVVCEEQVPCGVATTKLLETNSLTISPVSFEPDVRSVLGKIVTDEADAGIVYATDVLGRDAVESVAIPDDANVSTTYQAAVVADSGNSDAARAFVDYLRGSAAQAILADAGFRPLS